MTDRRSVLKAGLAAATASTMPAQTSTRAITTSVMLWTLPGSFEQRMETAAKGGVQSVELVSEHIRWTDAEIDSAKQLARSLRLAMDTIIATPDWAGRPVSLLRP